MRRIAKWAGLLAAGTLGVLALLVLVVLLGANTAPGRKALAWALPRLTSGSVHAEGISGNFPFTIRAERFVLSDATGPWLKVRNLALDWEPAQLFKGRIVVDRLAAGEAFLARLPEENESTAGRPAQPSKPMPLLVRELAVGQLTISPALASTGAGFSLNGSLERTASGDERLAIEAEELGGGGRYVLRAQASGNDLAASIHIAESPGGPISTAAGLPDLGAIRVDATLGGPLNRVAAKLAAEAGPLSLHGGGTIDLTRHTADVSLDARAPAMHPRPDLSWQSATLHATLSGAWDEPHVSGSAEVADLAAMGAKIAAITAAAQSSAGQVELDGQLSGIRLPGPSPDLLAGAPVTVGANVALNAAGKPVHFTLRHPLIAMSGEVNTAGQLSGEAAIDLPDLAPLAALAGAAASGAAKFKLAAAQHKQGLAVSADGTVRLDGGPPLAGRLLGPEIHAALAGSLHGSDIELSRLTLAGRDVTLGAKGGFTGGRLGLTFTSSLKDISQLYENASGSLSAKGTVTGSPDNLALAVDLNGTVGMQGIPAGPVQAHLGASGLPRLPAATLHAEWVLDGAPLRVALEAHREAAGAIAVGIDRAAWKSVAAKGTLALAPGGSPDGKISFSIGKLEDLSSIIGAPVLGSLSGTLTAPQASPARLVVALEGHDLGMSAVSAVRATLVATITDPLGAPQTEAKLSLSRVHAGGVQVASVALDASGTERGLAITGRATAPDLGGADLAASAHVDPAAGTATLSALTAHWRASMISLLGPAEISFARGLEIAHLRLGMAGAELSAEGRVTPTLALRVALRNVTPALIGIAEPGIAATGRLDAEATLSGTLARPVGRLRAHATGLGLASFAGVPPAALDLTADFAGETCRIQADLSAGSGTRLAIAGTVPLAAGRNLDLGAHGTVDLAMFDPVLAAAGRRVGGRLAVEARIGGSIDRPALDGSAQLTGGSVADYGQGLLLSDITARFDLAGDTLHIAELTGRAGSGSIGLSGSIGVLAPGLPVALNVTARDARLLQSDRISVILDSDLAISGRAEGQLAASGQVHIRRAEVRIPERMPVSIPVLNVVRAGARPPPAPAPGPDVALNITLDAPREIFVRGRGVDAEFGGRIHLAGSSAEPAVQGSLHLVRGQLSIAGQVLTFSQGTIGFNGGDPTDPTLDLVATTSTPSTTATLTLGGTVAKPTVTLSSSPQLPQDQVLAVLLFGRSAASLSPFQLAEIANALTSLTGVGPSVGNPLESIRQGLGLDQLTIGSDARGSPTLQAGRYVAPGVYVGANESTAGGGTSASVQIDLTKRLKLNATVGGATGSAPGVTPGGSPVSGTSVGLSYQFQY